MQQPRIAEHDLAAALRFTAHLRQERERRKITIASIAESTKILAALLERMESGDVSRWPSGFYRRAFIRAYATAIGLDAESVVRDFLKHFPDPDDQAPPNPPPPRPIAAPPKATRDPVLRMTLENASSFFSGETILGQFGQRCGAVAFDAFVLSVVALGLFLVLGAFWAPLAIASACYYFGSILLLGNTPGVCLFASPSRIGPHLRLWTRRPLATEAVDT